MERSFLLLEITDPEVNAFLWRMREIISGRQRRAAVHLTVRGPYGTSEPDQEILERARRQMRGDVLRIFEAGRFSNPEGEVVFLRVDSPHLKDIWWKPDYKGFHPHISIYRGADVGLADTVERVLSGASIDIYCAEHRLVWHRSGQRNLFDANEPTVSAMQLLSENSRLKPDVLDTLSDAIDTYRFGLRPTHEHHGAC